MSSYKYYDYIKNYRADFLNKYESWNHSSWGRKTNYTQLLNYRAYSLMTGRPILFYGIKIKGWFYMFGTLICLCDVYGIWWFQEMHNKYSSKKWIYYQPYLRKEMQFAE